MKKVKSVHDKTLKYRLMLWSFYAVAVIMKNIFATKRWKIGIFQAPAGYIFEPITFIAQDVETETQGYQSTKSMIRWGFILNIIVAASSQIAIWLPNASDPQIQTSFSIVLGNVPRILIASMTAYLIGGTLNAKIMSSLKEGGKTNLFSRAIISTLLGQLADNLIFSSMAFWGIIPIEQVLSMALTMTLLETIYEVVFYPLTKWVIEKVENS